MSTKTKSKVRLDLTVEQARIIEDALEIYSRCLLGQFWSIPETLYPTASYDDRQLVDKACRAVLTPELSHGCYYGIFSSSIPDSARVAYGIHRTLRYCRSWADAGKDPAVSKRDWNNMLGVNYDEPNTAGLPTPTCSWTSTIKVTWPHAKAV